MSTKMKMMIAGGLGVIIGGGMVALTMTHFGTMNSMGWRLDEHQTSHARANNANHRGIKLFGEAVFNVTAGQVGTESNFTAPVVTTWVDHVLTHKLIDPDVTHLLDDEVTTPTDYSPNDPTVRARVCVVGPADDHTVHRTATALSQLSLVRPDVESLLHFSTFELGVDHTTTPAHAVEAVGPCQHVVGQSQKTSPSGWDSFA